MSSSDKSSGIKSTSNPSTPQANSTNLHLEARDSLPAESTSSVDRFSDTNHNKEVLEPEDSYMGRETPLV